MPINADISTKFQKNQLTNNRYGMSCRPCLISEILSIFRRKIATFRRKIATFRRKIATFQTLPPTIPQKLNKYGYDTNSWNTYLSSFWKICFSHCSTKLNPMIFIVRLVSLQNTILYPF